MPPKRNAVNKIPKIIANILESVWIYAPKTGSIMLQINNIPSIPNITKAAVSFIIKGLGLNVNKYVPNKAYSTGVKRNNANSWGKRE